MSNPASFVSAASVDDVNAFAARQTFNGGVTLDATDSSGSPGNATINKPSGKVAVAIGASTVTVTNSYVTAASIVLCVIQFVDATLTTIRSVVPTSGAFTITCNANATAATKIAFVVVN